MNGMRWMAALLTVMAMSVAPGWAQGGRGLGDGVYLGSWDLNNDGTSDSAVVSRLDADGKASLNALTIPAGMAGPSAVSLAAGFGTWRVRANTRELVRQTFHTLAGGGNTIWVVTVRMTPAGAGRWTGDVKISQFSSILDLIQRTPPSFTLDGKGTDVVVEELIETW